jgi:hypothetical protein
MEKTVVGTNTTVILRELVKNVVPSGIRSLVVLQRLELNVFSENVTVKRSFKFGFKTLSISSYHVSGLEIMEKVLL